MCSSLSSTAELRNRPSSLCSRERFSMFSFFVFASFSQAGAGGAAPGGARGEEETPQEPERVRGPVLQAKRKVKKKKRSEVFLCCSSTENSPGVICVSVITVLIATRLTNCGLVPIETCRRRTAPHWRRSTASTSTSKPNCVCWRSSSAKETQQSSSENRFHKRDGGQIQVSIRADFFLLFGLEG